MISNHNFFNGSSRAHLNCGFVASKLKLVNDIQPILEREPSAWNHFQRPRADDRPNTKWEQWPSCTNDIQPVHH